MKMKSFVERAGSSEFRLDEKLYGAVHVQTVIKGDAMIIHAFYPDDHEDTFQDRTENILASWMDYHEEDIAHGIDDFGDLKDVFRDLLKREPRRNKN